MIQTTYLKGLVIVNNIIIIIHILDKSIIIFQRKTQMKLWMFDHIVIMNSNCLRQQQFNWRWPQMRCKVQPLHLVLLQYFSLEIFKKKITQLRIQKHLVGFIVMFDFRSRKVVHNKHNTLVSNPLIIMGPGWNFIRHFKTLSMSPNETNQSKKNSRMSMGRNFNTSSNFIDDQIIM
jgi:hypothetical protein